MARPRKQPAGNEAGKPKRAGNRAPAALKIERDARVVALRAQGLSWMKVAAEVKLTERGCRRIWSEWTKSNRHTVQNIDPLDVAIEVIARLDADIELLAEIGADEKQPGNIRVGAIKAKDAALAQQLELLQALDLLPRNLGKLQVELEIRHVIQALMLWAEEFVYIVAAEVRDRGQPDMPQLLTEAEGRLLSILRRNQPELPAASASMN